MTDRAIDRALRWAKELRMNQSALARAIGVSPQDITNWKARDIPADKHALVAVMLGRSIDELVGLPSRAFRPVENTEQKNSVARSVSQLDPTLPPQIDWERLVELVKVGALPENFVVEIPDDALAPKLPKGRRVWFRRASEQDKAQPRNVCLVRVSDRLYVRRIGQDESDRPVAYALDDAFPSFTAFSVEALMYMIESDSI